MALAENDIEERLLTLERKILRVRRQADDLTTWRVPKSEQQLAMLWAAGIRQPQYPVNFSCTVQACSGVVPGATVTVTETATGTVLATGATNSLGVFAATFNIGSTSVAATLAITSPATDRLASQSGSITLTPGTFTTTRTLAVTNSSLWICNSGRWYPRPSVLHVTDSVLGSVTLTWNSGSGRYIGTLQLFSFPGCGVCPPSTPPFFYIVNYSLNGDVLTVSHQGTANCCPSGNTQTCGDASGTVSAAPASPPYTATLTQTSFGMWYCGASVTFTITE